MHQFIKDLKDNPKVQARIRRDKEIEARTVQMVQDLLNTFDPLPGVGKLVFTVNIIGDGIEAEIGIKRESQDSVIQQPGA
jgi:hypothetical protein